MPDVVEKYIEASGGNLVNDNKLVPIRSYKVDY